MAEYFSVRRKISLNVSEAKILGGVFSAFLRKHDLSIERALRYNTQICFFYHNYL